MKPHEEQWRYTEYKIEAYDPADGGATRTVAIPVDPEDGPLAAAAPDMARVLLSIIQQAIGGNPVSAENITAGVKALRKAQVLP